MRMRCIFGEGTQKWLLPSRSGNELWKPRSSKTCGGGEDSIVHARGTRLLPFPMSDVARGRLRLRRVSPRNWFYDFAFAMRTGQEHIVNHCVAQPFQGSAPTPWGELIDLLNFGAKLPNERWNGLYASEVRTGGDAGHPGLTQDGDEAVRLRYTSTTQGTLRVVPYPLHLGARVTMAKEEDGGHLAMGAGQQQASPRRGSHGGRHDSPSRVEALARADGPGEGGRQSVHTPRGSVGGAGTSVVLSGLPPPRVSEHLALRWDRSQAAPTRSASSRCRNPSHPNQSREHRRLTTWLLLSL